MNPHPNESAGTVPERAVAPGPLILKAALAHTATYFIAGVSAYWLLNYREQFSHPPYTDFMRPLDDPMLKTGPMLQPIRGALFGLGLLPLRDAVFSRPRGWLVLWGVFFVLGILNPFGPAPGSIQGMIYTRFSFADQLRGLPETTIQSLLFSWTLFHWITALRQRWLGRTVVTLTILVYLMTTLGLFFAPYGATKDFP